MGDALSIAVEGSHQMKKKQSNSSLSLTGRFAF